MEDMKWVHKQCIKHAMISREEVAEAQPVWACDCGVFEHCGSL
jgi:hypothetical protein